MRADRNFFVMFRPRPRAATVVPCHDMVPNGRRHTVPHRLIATSFFAIQIIRVHIFNYPHSSRSQKFCAASSSHSSSSSSSSRACVRPRTCLSHKRFVGRTMTRRGGSLQMKIKICTRTEIFPTTIYLSGSGSGSGVYFPNWKHLEIVRREIIMNGEGCHEFDRNIDAGIFFSVLRCLRNKHDGRP